VRSVANELDDDELIEAWSRRERMRAGYRLLGIGALIFVPCFGWLVAFANWDSNAPVTRIKVVGGVASLIGGLLMLAGIVTLIRGRKMPEVIPRAQARHRDH
jgi:hypothetical protein